MKINLLVLLNRERGYDGREERGKRKEWMNGRERWKEKRIEEKKRRENRTEGEERGRKREIGYRKREKEQTRNPS
jgi:hypothetical protein